MTSLALGRRSGSEGRRLLIAKLGTCLILAAAVALGIVSLSWNSGPLFAGLVALLGCTTIGTVVMSYRRNGDLFSLLSLSAVFYLLGFGAGGVYFWFALDGPVPGAPTLSLSSLFGREDLVAAMAMANVAWLLLVFGYAANPMKVLPGATWRLRLATRRSSVGYIVGGLLLLGWLGRAQLFFSGRYFHTATPGAVAEATGSSWFIAVFASLPTLATALVGAASYLGGTGNQRRMDRAAFWVLVALEFVWYLPSGSRASIVALLVMIATVRYYGRGRRLHWAGAGATALVVVLVLLPFGATYRDSTRPYQLQPREALWDAAFGTFDRPVTEAIGAGVESTFSRFSDIASVAAISARGRDESNRKPWETLAWGPETLVPRALMSHKSDPGTYGNEFGRQYGFIDRSDFQTSIAPSQMGEMYLNFGLLGLVFGMPLIGAVYRLINDVLAARATNPGTLALWAVAVWPLVHGQESIVAVGLIGVLKTLLLWVLVVVGLDRLTRLAAVGRPLGGWTRSPA